MKNLPYTYEIIGEAESAWSGSQPADHQKLIKKKDKDVKSLYFQVLKSEVELKAQSGDIVGALESIDTYLTQEFEYANPLNIFRKDNQCGDIPYIGAHMVFGAIRDAITDSFYKDFGLYKKQGVDKNTTGTSYQKLKTLIRVKPNHIFLHRPALNGEKSRLRKIDFIDTQQPCGQVRGFSQYEVIEPPFQFRFKVHIIPLPPYEKSLNDRKLMEAVIRQSVYHGISARRSAGYGEWEIVKMKTI